MAPDLIRDTCATTQKSPMPPRVMDYARRHTVFLSKTLLVIRKY